MSTATNTPASLWARLRAMPTIPDGLDIYVGDLDLDIAKKVVRQATNGMYTVEAGSAEEELLGRNPQWFITLWKVVD